MCVVSMIYDHYSNKWGQWPYTWPIIGTPYAQPITPDEIAEFRKLLERAREYDKKNNQPDCELAEKKEKLRKIARDLGVEIDFLK